MHVALRIVSLAKDLEKSAAHLFREFDLSPAQFNVLNLLADQREGMRASDLARALIVDPSNVTGLLKRMSRRGLVAELDNLRDRRQHRVGLTREGRSVWERAHPVYEARLRSLEALLTPADLSMLERVLIQLQAELEAPA